MGLLDDLLGSVMGGATGQARGDARPTRVPGDTGGGMGNVLAALLPVVLSMLASRGSGATQAGGGLGDILGQVLGGGAQRGSGQRTGGGQGGGLGDILGQVLGGGGAGQAGEDPGEAPGGMRGRGPSAGGDMESFGAGAGGLGGLGALLEQMQRAGLGEQARSWVGTGQNMPVSRDEVAEIFGPGGVDEIARRTGLTPEQASEGLSALLPEVVDRVTPGGKVPEIDQLALSVEDLRRRLGA